MMNFLQFFSPQLVETCESEFSGKLEVYQFQNKYYIKTGDVHQSGGWANSLFEQALKKFEIQNFLPRRQAGKFENILVLGLAGGTIVNLLACMNPYMNITGVDIDSVMVNLGKKYFHLNEYKNLKIAIADAFAYIKSTKQQFGLIIVDLFKRDKVQIKIGDKDFINDVLLKISSKGYLMINRLYLPEFKKETDEYIEFLKKEEKKGDFKILQIFQNFGNKVLLLQKQGKI